jgi:hypothetical protein
MTQTKKELQQGFAKENAMMFAQALQRIFAVSVTNTTLRELNSVAVRIFGNDEKKIRALFNSFFSGKLDEELEKEASAEILTQLVRSFATVVSFAKEVHEKGDHLGFILSETIAYPDKTVLHNFVRKVDGTQIEFTTDIPTTLSVLNHFIVRLREAVKTDNGKEELNKMSPHLQSIMENMENLISG